MTKIRGVHEKESVIVVLDPDQTDPTWAVVDDTEPVCVVIKEDDWEKATEHRLGDDYREGEPLADIIDQRNRFRVACWALMDALSALPVDPRDLDIPIDAIQDLMNVENHNSIGLRKVESQHLVNQEELTAFLESRRANQ